MKVVNIMNFVRLADYREQNSRTLMFETTKAEWELIAEYDFENTFLLEYDALIDPQYIEFFKSHANEKTELGLWYELARPLVENAGLVWHGDPDQTWDWHIVPGFSLAYTKEERIKLVDEAMNRFREIYGYYPQTVASWLIDTFTVNYLSEKYHVSMVAICRDQTNTDAYTLIGGYFNQAYYPSKRNMFTPAQSEEYRLQTPVFRLLGPDPIHNYDGDAYQISEEFDGYRKPCTLEPIWDFGNDERVISYFFKTYFQNESLSFAYAQLGQENNFGCGGGLPRIIDGLRSQFDALLQMPDVRIIKMCDTGSLFQKTFRDTPASAVCALSEWNGDARIQSVIYDCKQYTANIFRFKNRIFIRSLYKFDETIADPYVESPCTTWDATYENLPIVDTLLWKDKNGFLLDEEAEALSVEAVSDSELRVYWKDKAVTFSETGIAFGSTDIVFDTEGSLADIRSKDAGLYYRYKGISYSVSFDNADIVPDGHTFFIKARDKEKDMTLFFNL